MNLYFHPVVAAIIAIASDTSDSLVGGVIVVWQANCRASNETTVEEPGVGPSLACISAFKLEAIKLSNHAISFSSKGGSFPPP